MRGHAKCELFRRFAAEPLVPPLDTLVCRKLQKQITEKQGEYRSWGDFPSNLALLFSAFGFPLLVVPAQGPHAVDLVGDYPAQDGEADHEKGGPVES
jgi:hypothetical protein